MDRLDYTKGIAQRIQAIDRLLDDHPELRCHVTLIQISAPSRVNIPEYAQERERLDSLVGKINGKFGETHWMPIHPLHRPYSQQDLAHLYREADACLVTPFRDGMNLVAKEFVASQTSDPGVLVISRFCGAAESMQDALMVNPYDFQQTASAHYRALVHPCPGYDLQNHLAFLDLQTTGGSQGLQHLRHRRPCRRRVRGVPVVHRHAQNFVFHGKPRDPNTRNSLLNFFQEAIRDLHLALLLFFSGFPLLQPVIPDIRHTLQANHLPQKSRLPPGDDRH